MKGVGFPTQWASEVNASHALQGEGGAEKGHKSTKTGRGNCIRQHKNFKDSKIESKPLINELHIIELVCMKGSHTCYRQENESSLFKRARHKHLG